MNVKEMEKIIAHCDQHFKQNDCIVRHIMDTSQPHIDILVYKPNDAYPYWKLVTMGASDYQMPKVPNALGNRNEYVMFIDPSENLEDNDVVGWYSGILLEIAVYARSHKKFVSYAHCIEWGEEEGSDMVSAFLEMPQVTKDVSFLKCKYGLMKTAVFLQAILLTRAETDHLMKIGPQAFSDYLYPESFEKAHFLCERFRSERF